jgi:heterodisulfide reductase subunit B
LLTCKQFLQELNDFLDDTLDPAIRAELQKHVTECPNCWVVFDTTQRTLKVFKGMQPQPLPEAIEKRLLEAIEKKCKAKRARAGETSAEA